MLNENRQARFTPIIVGGGRGGACQKGGEVGSEEKKEKLRSTSTQDVSGRGITKGDWKSIFRKI